MQGDVATAIARILKQENIDWVSTFPVCRVNNALGREGVRLLMMRDDRYAVALADAFSRVTAGQRIGVCTVQGGVNAAGLQVAYAGLAQAYEDGSPVLCLTDGVPAGSSENSQFDLTASLKSVSKWYGYIDKPERVPEFMRRAFTQLRSGRPGPVVLAVPEADATFDLSADPYQPVKGWKTAPDPADIDAAIDHLLAAARPLIYAGEGLIYAGAAEEFAQFVTLANAPVVVTLKAKGILREDHPLFVGVRGDHVTEHLDNCDLVFGLGSSLSPGRFSHGIPNAASKTIVQCIIDEQHVNKMHPVTHAVLGDARLALQSLNAKLIARTGDAGRPPGTVAADVGASRSAGLAKYREAMTRDETPINPYRVYKELAEILDPEASFVTHDSGNTRDQLSTVYDTLIPRGFLGWGNVSTLGFSLPAALAAKIAFPQRQCIAVTGDAGVGYMLGNLEVPVRERIGVTILHISNGGFAGYGPGFWGEGHDPYTYQVVGHDQIDSSKAIGELGLFAQRVDQPGQLASAIQDALAANDEGRPAYIEVICSQYPVYGQWVARS